MAGSSSERAIRTAVVDYFHRAEPKARVVHELNVAGQGTNRADLGIVLPDYLILVEIKSEKDVLKRLEKQFREFARCAHEVLIVAHDKHFDGDGLKAQPWIGWSHKEHIWRYPEPTTGDFRWRFNRYRPHIQPHSYAMLDMLWAEELTTVCGLHGVGVSTRRWEMIRDLQLMLTGDEVRKAVCQQLRSRHFAEADDPILTGPKPVVVSKPRQEAML